MERAGRVVGKLSLAAHGVSDEQLAIAAWPVAVGKKIAMRTRSVSLIRERLVVEVEDRIWQQQLFTLRSQLIGAIQKVLGRTIVAELEFRIAVPRRPPVIAVTASTFDEADSIKDPILRGIYVAARKKATA